MAALAEFKLSQVLAGHSADVKAVLCCQGSDAIVSASRDGTVRLWAPAGDARIYETSFTMEGHSNFVNAVVEIPPSEDFPLGAFATGSADTLVLVWDRRSLAEPLFTLLGHTNTVCSLAYSQANGTLFSGSYDG